MFLKKRYIRSYAPVLAQKYGLTEKQVLQILTFGLTNLTAALVRREEIVIRGLFTIYLNKRLRAREIRKWQGQKAATQSLSADAS